MFRLESDPKSLELKKLTTKYSNNFQLRKIDEECEGEEENEVEKVNDKQNQEEQNERRKYDKGFYLMTPHNDEMKNESDGRRESESESDGRRE